MADTILSSAEAIRSIQQLRTEAVTDHGLAAIATELESDVEAHAEALLKPWCELSDKARRIVTCYLVKDVRTSSPALPIDEQFRIVWRCPRPTAELVSTRESDNRAHACRRTANA